MAVVSKRLSLDEFLRLPEEEPAFEFEDGEVTQKVSPSGEHGALQFGLTMRLGIALQAQKTARVFTETRVTLAGVSRVPDACIYLWDRVPVTEAGNVAREFRVPPDITIEIVSPEQSVNALVRKCLWYIEQGVQVVLLVDPIDQSILVFRPDAGMAIVRGTDRVDLEPVLPGFDLTVDEVFEALRHQ